MNRTLTTLSISIILLLSIYFLYNNAIGISKFNPDDTIPKSATHSSDTNFNRYYGMSGISHDSMSDIASDNIDEDEMVLFADENLEEKIREILGVEIVLKSDLARITSLTLSSSNIFDLTGLEYAVNLEFLDLDFNQISDLSPLSGLANLKVLSLYQNQISDISPLSELKSLKSLCIKYNRVSDISPLSGLENLMILYLGNNRISDIFTLTELTNLRLLSLIDNRISDISSLAELTNIEVLYLVNNNISDLMPLIENPGLNKKDKVTLYNNPLDLDDCSDINALHERDVVISIGLDCN